MINKIDAPSFHLGCDYKLGNDGLWSIGTETYVNEALEKVKSLLGRKELGKEHRPMSPGAHPESDKSPLLDVDGHRMYQQLVGIAQWLITCGRLDLCYAVSSLSCYSACPRENHLVLLERVFRYLNKNRALAIKIDPKDLVAPKHNMMFEGADWSETYPGAYKERDLKLPQPKGKNLRLLYSLTLIMPMTHRQESPSQVYLPLLGVLQLCGCQSNKVQLPQVCIQLNCVQLELPRKRLWEFVTCYFLSVCLSSPRHYY